MTGSIIIHNATSQVCHVFVSKYSNNSANDSWFALQPGQSDSWGRNGWELVAFKNENDSDRGGVYVRVDSTVTYNGLNNINVK